MTTGTFGALVDAFLTAEFEASPIRASQLGLTDYDERFDDLSADAFRQRDNDAEAWLDRFESVPEDELTADEQIDRGLAIAVLRGRTILADWQNWRRDPLTYSGAAMDSVFTLYVHRLRGPEELADATVARLEQMPRALEQGAANLDPTLAHPVLVQRGAASARGAIRYLRELLPAEAPEGPARERVAAAGEVAAQGFERWVEVLDRLAEQASGEWQLGEERYTRLLREKELLRFDARALRDHGQAEYDRLDAEMRALAEEAFGDEDYPRILAEANRDHAPTEEAMRATYEEWTERARAFLRDHRLTSFPEGERCAVVPSPVFQRPVLGVAFYIAPPAFADTMLGHFFVPFAPEGASEEVIRERLEGNNNGDIPTTSVHEAYPGHHWHLVMRKLNPSRLRRVYSTAYFSEGWALYAERMMRERGFFTQPIQELFHLNATIFRAARIVVDTSLHLGEMTFEEAVDFMVQRAALPESVARAEVGRYCSWPTQASSYLTGCLEILSIRERYLAARGLGGSAPADVDPGVMRDFHDAICSSGALPLGLAERAVMQTLG